MGITNFSAINANLGPSIRNNNYERYTFTKFLGAVADPLEVDGTAAVVTDAGVNVFNVEGYDFMYFVEQAFGGTIPQVLADQAAGGLSLVTDAADNDGILLGLPWCTTAGQGTLKTAGRGIFLAGTDEFFVKVKLKIADVSEADEIAVGFAKVQAVDTNLTNFTDFAVLNVDNGTIEIQTDNDNAGPSTVDTTQDVADAGSISLEVRVASSGAVKFLIDGLAPTVDVTGFTFDSGDSLFPFVWVLNDVAGTPGVIVQQWESGLLTHRGLDGINDLTN